MRVNKKRCTETVMGKVIKIKDKGVDFPTIITVQYEVNNNQYEISESIKLRCEWVKIGFLPVGQKKYAVMGDTKVGSMASVTYNPDNPQEAYITKNIGRITS